METQTQSNWVIDVAHSEIQFKVRHMCIPAILTPYSGQIDPT